jgi:hypothetical protein
MWTLALLALGASLAGEPAPETPKKPFAPKALQWDFGTDGKQTFRILFWSQFWARIQQMNPGTTVQGDDKDLYGDVGIRRARLLVFGKPHPRLLVLTHFGINNQTFSNARKPQMYIHDAWIQGDVVPEYFSLGIGLHYFNGVSRASNESTMGFLTLDSPIFVWPTIERTDQFARQLGIFAKGKVGPIDYRVAVNKPFAPSTELTAGGPTNFRPDAHSWSVASYVKAELLEPEGNTLPFLPGTYLGKKRVFNLGLGVHWQQDALGRLVAEDEEETYDLLAIGADVFADLPIGGGAFTGYGLYTYTDFGTDFVRNVGIMNLGAGGTSANGPGNAYPMFGTGHTAYVQAGYLMPFGERGVRVQPYVAVQASLLDGLDGPMVLNEAGANLYLLGQNMKLTFHWRGRPFFEDVGGEVVPTSRAHEGILQAAFRY